MQKISLKCRLVTALIVLMLALSSCATKPKQDENETPKIVIAGIETVYFPAFPYPDDDVVIPLDADKNIVINSGASIEYVMLPYWYWKLIIEYVIDTENAVDALAQHPP